MRDSLKGLAGGVDWDKYGWQGNLSALLDLVLVMWVAIKASLAVFANAGYGFKRPAHETALTELRQIFEQDIPRATAGRARKAASTRRTFANSS